MVEVFRTIKSLSEGSYSEKRSRFLSFAIPVGSAEDVKEYVQQYRKKYYDAHHVCWAYVLGVERDVFRVNDDGEPSSTAGKPILGQINAYGLTNILILVVRYFGGVELGTGGLIAAYRKAAAEAIVAAETEECTVDELITITYKYDDLNKVMRILKEMQPQIVLKKIEMTCEMTLRIQKTLSEQLKNRLIKEVRCKIESRQIDS